MRRYYLSPIIGTGTLNDPYRVEIADQPNTTVSAVIPTGADGKPRFTHALCIAAKTSHQALLSNNRFGPLPDMPLDARMNALSNNARNQLDAALAKFGIPQGSVVTNEGYREFIRSLGRVLDPAFDENALGVEDR